MGNSKPLSAKFVETVRTAGVYRDKGNPGLLLRVEPNGSKRWVLRTTVIGRRRDFGLGSASDVSLRDVREQAALMRREARAGRDPVEQRRAAKRARLSFEAAAEKVHAGRQGTWRNTKHQAQWISTLRTYAFPTIGKMAVGDVQAADVLKVLAPIWLTKPETARRVRQRIGIVLDWATTAGHRSSLTVNAAHAVRGGLPKQTRRTKHHPAVPWRDIPALVKQLREAPSTEAVRFALEFTLLTAARTGETIGARWPEIDVVGRTWTVPAERMKGHRIHRVPLSEPAMQILEACRERWPNSKFVFPGRDENGPLSNMALLMLMRRLGRKEVPHGLRSSFRDWAADNRKDREQAESALAHALSDKTEAAYRRSDLFDSRPRADGAVGELRDHRSRVTAVHERSAQTMAKTHYRNLPRPNKQRLSRFKTKLRKIAAGADERISPEEMTSLLPHVGADLMTKAYLADPDRFIASIDTSVIPFLPQVVVTHIRRRVFELHTMPPDTGDIFAVPARSMNKDELCAATRLLLERCKILHAAYKQMQSRMESAQLREAVGEIRVPPDGRDLLSTAPQSMKKAELIATARLLRERCKALHTACEQMKGDADVSFQSMEEKRHAGSSSLTAVRLWPIISHLLDDDSEEARAAFLPTIRFGLLGNTPCSVKLRPSCSIVYPPH